MQSVGGGSNSKNLRGQLLSRNKKEYICFWTRYDVISEELVESNEHSYWLVDSHVAIT